MDPLAGDYAGWSPYNYVLGNPVRLVDPDGKIPQDPGDPKPTIINLKYGYTIKTSNFPFVDQLRSISGNFTQLNGPVVTGITFGDPNGGFQINVQIPRVYPHNRNNPSYTTESYSGPNLDNLQKINNKSIASAFFDGFKTGYSAALIDEAVSSGIFANYKLPSRFKLVPSNKRGGIRFIDPKNAQNEVRIMEGNPNSPHLRQQSAYLKYRHEGTYYDVNGNPIKSAMGGGKSELSHIPLKDFNPKVMPKF